MDLIILLCSINRDFNDNAYINLYAIDKNYRGLIEIEKNWYPDLFYKSLPSPEFNILVNKLMLVWTQ